LKNRYEQATTLTYEQQQHIADTDQTKKVAKKTTLFNKEENDASWWPIKNP